MNELIWLGSSRKDIATFDPDARKEAGYQLFRVQEGKDPSDWKPMSCVGSGVREIRIHTGKAYRVIYVAKFLGAVYVLHAFEKKSQKTPLAETELAAKRYRSIAARKGIE